MLVYGYKGDQSGFMEVNNDLHDLQRFVGGLIEVVALTSEIDLVLNEEGLLQGLDPRVVFVKDGKFDNTVIMGDCFVCRHDRKGNFTDIKKSDTKMIEDRLFHLKSRELKMLGLLFILQQ